MLVFRISMAKYASKLTASGRENRWNRTKQYVLYASESRALATLEMVAHRNAEMEFLPYKLITIALPDSGAPIRTTEMEKLPPDWQKLKHRNITKTYGSDWYENRESLALKVPSALVAGEYNYMINTTHPNFADVSILEVTDFIWDRRLL